MVDISASCLLEAYECEEEPMGHWACCDMRRVDRGDLGRLEDNPVRRPWVGEGLFYNINEMGAGMVGGAALGIVVVLIRNRSLY
jgi:hypothetical protein